jgi:hypothetical protein
MNDPAVAHHTQHANANDAIASIQAVIGVTNSTVATSINYKLNQLQAKTSLTLSNKLKTAAYAIEPQDYFIRVDATAASVDITLPAASTSIGKVFVIKKVDSSANPVILKTSGTDLIDTFLTQELATQGNKITVIANESGWNVV